MSFSLNNKNISKTLMLTVVALEVTALVIAFFLDICLNIPLITNGRISHYILLVYLMLLIWSNLYSEKIEQKWQLLIFAIIPNIEFFLINYLGYSNLWGLLFLGIYGSILSSIFDVNLSNGGSSWGNIYVNKIIKSVIKGLRR